MQAIQIAVEDFFCEFERRYSRFKPDSWLSQLNQDRVFNNPDPEFVQLLRQSLDSYQETGGVFNIAIGEQMDASGYDPSYSFTQTKKLPEVLPPLPELLTVSPEIIILKAGRLDLGGIGKGFAIDLVVQLLQVQFDLRYFVVNGGGDIYVTSDNGAPISIALTHPQDQSLAIGSVALHNQGFASSSPYVRSWSDRKTGERQNHLQTSNQVSSYIVSANCCAADVWATTLCVNPNTPTPSNSRCLLLTGAQVLQQDTLFQLHA
jgi:thiamine biosynthesis lipoprotein